MDLDSIEYRIRTLTNQHATLETLLAQKTKGHSWDEYEIEKIKKEKLKIKDELTTLYRKQRDLRDELDWDDH